MSASCVGVEGRQRHDDRDLFWGACKSCPVWAGGGVEGRRAAETDLPWQMEVFCSQIDQFSQLRGLAQPTQAELVPGRSPPRSETPAPLAARVHHECFAGSVRRNASIGVRDDSSRDAPCLQRSSASLPAAPLLAGDEPRKHFYESPITCSVDRGLGYAFRVGGRESAYDPYTLQ